MADRRNPIRLRIVLHQPLPLHQIRQLQTLRRILARLFTAEACVGAVKFICADNARRACSMSTRDWSERCSSAGCCEQAGHVHVNPYRASFFRRSPRGKSSGMNDTNISSPASIPRVA
ncbi:hypothetical protein PMIN04_008390 [Paraphaeosphaeria minitans]